jgi:hypothetical protein
MPNDAVGPSRDPRAMLGSIIGERDSRETLLDEEDEHLDTAS